MSVIRGVVATVIAPLALAEGTVQVFHRPHPAALTEHRRIRANKLLAERRRLPHESMDDLLVRLREHGRDHIPLGGEIEEGEEVLNFLDFAMVFRGVDVAELVHERVADQPVIPKGEPFLKVQLFHSKVGHKKIKNGG